jgi:methylenetetrahydrofolate reductase (NADPH)
MRILDLFRSGRKVLSFELFPPKRDGDLEQLFGVAERLKSLEPGYISITYGAGGSSRDRTYDIAVRLKELGVVPLMHFTCVGHSRDEIRGLLDRVREAGIENVLALRGDPPKGQAGFRPAPDGFRYAEELIRFIRKEGYGFCLGVAGYPEGHPEAGGKDRDLGFLERKVAAGGEFVVTQLFFDNADYFEYVHRARDRGLEIPVQPGVWLLTEYSQVERIAGFGAKVPAWLEEELRPYREDREGALLAGVGIATRQCKGLLDGGAPGIHFYVMNKSRSVEAVLANLKAQGYVFG